MDEGIRRGRDILDKSISWKFLHIPQSSVNKSSRVTLAAISFNEEGSILVFHRAVVHGTIAAEI